MRKMFFVLILCILPILFIPLAIRKNSNKTFVGIEPLFSYFSNLNFKSYSSLINDYNQYKTTITTMSTIESDYEKIQSHFFFIDTSLEYSNSTYLKNITDAEEQSLLFNYLWYYYNDNIYTYTISGSSTQFVKTHNMVGGMTQQITYYQYKTLCNYYGISNTYIEGHYLVDDLNNLILNNPNGITKSAFTNYLDTCINSCNSSPTYNISTKWYQKIINFFKRIIDIAKLCLSMLYYSYINTITFVVGIVGFIPYYIALP